MVVVLDLGVHALQNWRIADIVVAALKVFVFVADLAGMRLHLGIKAAFDNGVLVCWWPLLQAEQIPSAATQSTSCGINWSSNTLRRLVSPTATSHLLEAMQHMRAARLSACWWRIQTEQGARPGS